MSATKWLIGLLVVIALVVAVMSVDSPRKPEDEQAALLEADLAFAAATLTRGGNGWASFFLEDGVMFPPTGRVDGRDAIREVMLPVFAPGEPRLEWEPISATVAASGDIGYTIGRWKSVGADSIGADTILFKGNYVTIWKKDADDRWRVAADIGNYDTR
ncbi:MAG: DUF4440 domain-containing protein [Candidatus Krumholzibacteriota bacterium]|nr:DUF4440 domain-containing protein [Candidatus Krumholzibacteriota bacterium]